MAMQTIYPAKINSPPSVLTSGATAGDTTIYVDNIEYFESAPNLATIGEDDDAETILYEGMSGASGAGSLTSVTRGFEGVAKAWDANEVIARNITAYDYDALSNNLTEHNHKLDDLTTPDDNTDLNVSTSAHGLCPKVDSGGALIGNIVALSAGESQASWCQIRMDNLNDVDYNASNIGNVLGLSDTGWTDIELSHSIFRQAIINGNFDVWQRGTTVTDPAQLSFLADRWHILRNADGGTLPTIIHSRQALTSGEIDGSYYFYRINVNGAGSSLGDRSHNILKQKVEFGTRYLCGSGKKVTLSFKARSSISGKKIGFYLLQHYGTGGSPSSAEALIGSTETLTSDWQSFSFTFDTNTLSGKTFGTNNDDYLGVELWEMWGSNYASNFGESTAEDFGGSGNIDIAQVQVCAGEVALPFQPKSYDQEYRDCLRYFFDASKLIVGFGFASSTVNIRVYVPLLIPMRATPSVIISGTSSNYSIWTGGSNSPLATGPALGGASDNFAYISGTVASGLTTGHFLHLQCGSGHYLWLDAEL